MDWGFLPITVGGELSMVFLVSSSAWLSGWMEGVVGLVVAGVDDEWQALLRGLCFPPLTTACLLRAFASRHPCRFHFSCIIILDVIKFPALLMSLPFWRVQKNWVTSHCCYNLLGEGKNFLNHSECQMIRLSCWQVVWLSFFSLSLILAGSSILYPSLRWSTYKKDSHNQVNWAQGI